MADYNQQWWRERISAYLTPILISVIGALLWFQWQEVSNTLNTQGQTQSTMISQLATIHEQILEGQGQIASIQNQMSHTQSEQMDHEHRITVLETRRP